MKHTFLSTTQVAKLLGISRIAVFKKIKGGHINAQKVGRNFVVDQDELPAILGTVLNKKKKHEIEIAVKKTAREYGQVLRLLATE